MDALKVGESYFPHQLHDPQDDSEEYQVSHEEIHLRIHVIRLIYLLVTYVFDLQWVLTLVS